MSTSSKSRPWGRAALTIAVGLLLAGCAAPAPEGSTPEVEAPAGAGDVQAAAALVQQRYELVRDGDYEGACALYSEQFTELFIDLADAAGSSCAEAHAIAAQGALDYLAAAAEQDRAGLVPFFFVPSAIEIDRSAIKNDEAGLAFLGAGSVTSLDPREFEDGAGTTPGWLAAEDYLKRGDDGTWQFIAMTEQ